MITQDDFNCIGQIAKHCDNTKLCIAIDEAFNFDLSELFCDELITEAYENFNDTDVNSFWYKLWNGSTYENACGNNRNHLGLKRVWVYQAYSRYIILNSYNDTASGMVSKTHDYSMPIPVQELKYYENKYRDMGYSTFKKVKDFICQNKDEFTVTVNLECESDCGGCGSEKCGSNITTKTGFKFKTIRKYD